MISRTIGLLAAITLLAGCGGGGTEDTGDPGAGGTGDAAVPARETRGERALRHKAMRTRGVAVYRDHCLTCHQVDGGGVPWMQPPLAGSAIVTGPVDPLIELTLRGIGADEPGTLPATGEWSQNMAGFRMLSDEDIASVLTYIRDTWGNDADAVEPAFVSAVRNRLPDPTDPSGSGPSADSEAPADPSTTGS